MFGIFSMLIDPGAPGQAYVVGIICHLPDMIRINALAKYWWEPIPTSLLPIRSGALADHSFFEKMLFDKSYVFSQWNVNVTVYQISHSIMIQWENIKVSDFKRNSNQTIDLGVILDSTGRITMLFKHSPFSLVCLIAEHVRLFFFKEKFHHFRSH